MIKVTLLTLFLVSAYSANAVSNTFSDPTVSTSPFVVYPRYPLGNLKANDEVTLVLNMPYSSDATLADFTITLYDSTDTDSGVVFDTSAGGTNAIIVGAGLVPSDKTYYL